MGSVDDCKKSSSASAITQFNAKAADLETNLRINLETFKELILDVEQIKHELETCKTELSSQKQKCERKMCCSSEIYEKIIESKNNIIQLAVTTTIRIDETKNLSMLSELLKILCGDIEMLPPPTDLQGNKENLSKRVLVTPQKKILTKSNSPVKKKKTHSPKKELYSSLEDVSFKEDSVSEIEATPGRTSPIIQSKKLKSSSSVSLSGTSTDSRDKKKCPDNWNTPEAKQLKLCYSSPKRVVKGKTFRQSRLSVVFSKPSNVVDLTCSPELSGGSGNSDCQKANVASQNPQVQLLIKKEPSENDDTILPSPTSGPPDIALSRNASKDKNFKKPLSFSRVKAEHFTQEDNDSNSPIIQFVDKKCNNTTKENVEAKLEESINILKPNRFGKSPLKLIKRENSPAKVNPSPVKVLSTEKSPAKPDQLVNGDQVPMDEDVTHCEESSMSILQHVNKLEKAHNSPCKRPLGVNQNIVNVPAASSPTRDMGTTVQDNHKRKIFEKVEPVYKEPTVRKKAEKLALPGWCCDECKNFFGNLYGDDAEKIKVVIDRCSKHRGRNNPVRAKTPPGFWEPRWSVPEDTEEFNRRNNAD